MADRNTVVPLARLQGPPRFPDAIDYNGMRHQQQGVDAEHGRATRGVSSSSQLLEDASTGEADLEKAAQRSLTTNVPRQERQGSDESVRSNSQDRFRQGSGDSDHDRNDADRSFSYTAHGSGRANSYVEGGFVALLLDATGDVEMDDSIGDNGDHADSDSSDDEVLPSACEQHVIEAAEKILRQTPRNSIDSWVIYRRRLRYRRLGLFSRVVACTLAIQMREEEKETLRNRIPVVRFNINSLTEKECIDRFRFRKVQVAYLLMKFKLPPFFSTEEGYRVSGIEALCITLERLGYPSRWQSLVPKFGRSRSNMGSIFYYVCEHISTRCAPLLVGDWSRISTRLEDFASAIRSKGATLFNVWGFIDGTVRRICRLGDSVEQRAMYNGHKRSHGVKYQAVTTPDGIIVHMHGPAEGRSHDLTLLDASNLEDTLAADSRFTGHLIYGDPAYGMTDVFASPFDRIGTTTEEAAVNASMSRVRINVEWGFGVIIGEWAMVDFKRKMAIGNVPVGMLYEVAAILTNCLTIARHQNIISSYFDVTPPSFEDYFACLP